MGLADREYETNNPRPRPRLTPVVKGLLWLQVLIFLVDYMVLKPTPEGYPPMVSWGAFTVQSALFEFRIWEFLTFQFLHDSLGHVLFNSIGLFFFGPFVERWWGAWRFLVYYLLCGCAGAGLFTLLVLHGVVPGDVRTGLIGASAGIYGILTGVAVIAPGLRVMLLFPPIELSMRQLAIGLMGLSAVLILVQIGGNEGGEAGHLGGAIGGILLMRMPWLLGRVQRSRKVVPFPGRSVPSKLGPRPRILDSGLDPVVEEILDKISREGLGSLTEHEREVLDEAARNQQDQR